MELTWGYTKYVNSMLDDTNLWNNLGFGLYAVLFVCYIVTTSDKQMKSEMEVSTNWYITVEYQRSSSIRVHFHQLLDEQITV